MLRKLQISILHFLLSPAERIRRLSSNEGSHSALLQCTESNSLGRERLLQPAPMRIQRVKIAVLQLSSNIHLAVSPGQLQL